MAKKLNPKTVEEIEVTEPFFVINMNNGISSKKLQHFSDVIEWMGERVDGPVPTKITIRQMGYGRKRILSQEAGDASVPTPGE